MATLGDTLKNMGAARNTLVAVIAVAMVIGFMFLAMRVSTGTLSPLYTGLTLEDSAKIVAELEKSNIHYELLGNGSQIMVPSEQVLRLRMNMASAGLPATGSIVGYEIFDRSETLGSSNFVMNINMVRALEGELSRTIASLTNVETARVHLVMPRQEMFSREKNQPSASVTIKMRGQTLESGEVNAITHLVAAAVPGLSANKVTVVDSHGKLLARGDGDNGMSATNSSTQEFRIAYENRMQRDMEELLEKVIGVGKVRVQVSADINFDRTVTNSEKYDPDGQVARSVQSNTERDNAQDVTAKENVSAANNLPQANQSNEPGASSNHLKERTDETTNFEISKTVQNHVSEGGVVKKVSVAVLVDGMYTQDNDGKSTYAPRSDEELQKLKLLVSSSIGYDEKRGDKIEVVNMRFTQDTLTMPDASFFERFKLEMQSVMQTLIIAIVAILAIVLVLRPAVNQMIRQSQANSQARANELGYDMGAMGGSGGGGQLPNMRGGNNILGGINLDMGEDNSMDPDTLIDVANIRGGMKQSTMKKVNDIIEKYPDETMTVLRNWVLKQS